LGGRLGEVDLWPSACAPEGVAKVERMRAAKMPHQMPPLVHVRSVLALLLLKLLMEMEMEMLKMRHQLRDQTGGNNFSSRNRMPYLRQRRKRTLKT
jgi:hypothetical protein